MKLLLRRCGPGFRPRGGRRAIPLANGSQPPTERVLISGLTKPQGLAFDHLDGREALYVLESDQLDRYVWTGKGPAAQAVVLSHLPDTGPANADFHRLKKSWSLPPTRSISTSPAPRTRASRRRPAGCRVLCHLGAAQRHERARVRNWGSQRRRAPSRPTGRCGPRSTSATTLPTPSTLRTTKKRRGRPGHPGLRQRPSAGRGGAPRACARRGWPYCNPDPDVDPGAAATTERYTNPPFDRDAQTNATGARPDCANLAPIERASRPIVPRSASASSTITLVSGFQTPDGNRWGRPVDALPGPDGSLRQRRHRRRDLPHRPLSRTDSARPESRALRRRYRSTSPSNRSTC